MLLFIAASKASGGCFATSNTCAICNYSEILANKSQE